MWPSGRSRSTANRTRPGRRSARTGWPRAARARSASRRHVDELGREVQHDRRLVGAAVDAHAQLLGRRPPALVGGHARVGEERHQAVGQTQLAVGDADQRRVAAVAVEEHERLRPACVATQRPMSSSTASSVVGRQPDRAGRPGVLVRLRVRERRQQPDVELVARPVDRRRPRPVGHDQVGVERQVRPVLLDRAERLHEPTGARWLTCGPVRSAKRRACAVTRERYLCVTGCPAEWTPCPHATSMPL